MLMLVTSVLCYSHIHILSASGKAHGCFCSWYEIGVWNDALDNVTIGALVDGDSLSFAD